MALSLPGRTRDSLVLSLSIIAYLLLKLSTWHTVIRSVPLYRSHDHRRRCQIRRPQSYLGTHSVLPFLFGAEPVCRPPFASVCAKGGLHTGSAPNRNVCTGRNSG